MIKHRTRLISIVVIVVAAVAALVADRWLGLADDVRALLREIVQWGLLAVGGAAVADAFFVEGRRKDPTKPALPDDVRDELPEE